MGRKILKNLIFIFAGILAAELLFLGYLTFLVPRGEHPVMQTQPTAAPTEEVPTQETTAPTQPETTVPTEATTAPTETEAPTESGPREQRYVLTFAGDCTLGSDPGQYASSQGFIGTIGTDYGYPFRNVAEYFRKDDFTIINLESVLADSGTGANKLFVFRGPTAYTEILTGSGVEAVTLANNHTEDYGKTGYESTTTALTGAGVAYVEENKTRIYTTESGLTIGLYADSFYFNKKDIEKNVKSLKDQGAEIIVCAFHWGTEGSYRATADQQAFAKAAIDAGADIIYGHHPHVLQKIETYKDGIIFYSLGNFSFGGNHFPRDMDSAIVQQEIIRDLDGSLRLGELTIIPVSISSMKNQNNFQPTPYEPGSAEYDRVMSKLDGTFTGPDLVVDYSHLKPTDPTEPPTESPTEVPSQPGNDSTGPADVPTEGDGGEPPVTEPAESGDEVAPPATEAPAPPPEDNGANAPEGDSGETPPPAEGGDSSGTEG